MWTRNGTPGILGLATAFWCVTALACAPHATPNPPSLPNARPRPTIVVHNHQLEEMRIFAVSGSAEYRLGTVASMSTARFDLPRVVDTPADVRFLARTLASGDTRATETVLVVAGDSIELVIGQTPVLTSLLVHR